MRKTYKFLLYPTRLQVDFLTGQLREAAALYNAAIQDRRDTYRWQHRSVSYFEQAYQLKDIRAAGHLGIVNAQCAQDVLRRVDGAFQAFFRRIKRGEKAGYPRFRSARRYDSLTFPQHPSGCKLLDSGKLRIQGTGEVKVKLHRKIEGTIKTVTIKREANRWYVMFSVEYDATPLPANSDSVGIDVGIASFAVLSDGTNIENPRYYRKSQALLRVSQRRVARRKRGSHGRQKAIQLLQRDHAHITNQRSDFQHKTARDLVNRFGFIAVEDLNIKGLAAGMLAKSVQDAGWGLFLDKLTSKAVDAGRQVVRVDPHGTTQNCSSCGTRVPKTLSQRWHNCPNCGLSLSRDENSAREILGRGLRLAELTWPVAAFVSAEAAQLQLAE